jgi:hypothetical protein
MQLTRGGLATVVMGTLALAVRCGIAWMDTRPNWDDAGATAGALLLAGVLAAVVGLRWRLAVLLVAGPIAFTEWPSAGWGVLAMVGFAVAGSVVGTALRRFSTSAASKRDG